MIIQCDECQAKFKLDDSKISDKGAKVRCSKCKHVFTVHKEPAAPPVEEPAAPPVEDESFGMDMSDNDDLFGEADDTHSSSPEESDLGISVDSVDEDLSWGGLAGNLDGLDIEFEEPEADKPIGSDVAGFGLEGEDDVAGFGLEGEDDIAGFGLEGEDDIAGFGLEGEDEAAGFGLEGEDEAAGFGLEGEGETTGFGLEGEGETTGFGLEGEGETTGFGLDDEGETAGSNEQPDSGYADLDLDTGPGLSGELDVADSSEETIPQEQEAFSRAAPGDVSDEGFESSTDSKTNTKTTQKTEKSAPKFLIILLVLALTLGGAYYIIVSKSDVVIAGYDIGRILRDAAESLGISSKPDRSGKIDISDLNGYYLQSEKDGLIFIIEGSASNNFNGPRSFISIKGTLFDGSGKPVMEESAFCGNTFTKDELATLSREKIGADLQSRLGKGLINSNISPGKKIPFMLVFYSTPENLAEFNVEVTGSEDAMRNVE